MCANNEYSDLPSSLLYIYNETFKGRFLEVRRYHTFANLCSKLSESAVYKEIGKFQ